MLFMYDKWPISGFKVLFFCQFVTKGANPSAISLLALALNPRNFGLSASACLFSEMWYDVDAAIGVMLRKT
jgi:hypothetical protein